MAADVIDNKLMDVLIIGCGVSGLTTAYKIHQKEKSLNIVLVEAAGHIGGQLNSSDIGELGAKWINEDQYHIYNLLRELKVKMHKRYFLRNDLKRCWDIDNGFFAHFWNFEINLFIRRIDLKCMNYYPGNYKLNNNSVKIEKYIRNTLFFEKSREFVRTFVKLICGVDSKNVSLEEFLSTCCSSGGLSKLITLYTGASNSLLEFSSEELLSKLQLSLPNVTILKKTKIIEIFNYSDFVLVRDDKGNIYHTPVLVLAISWNSVNNLKFYPPIPQELQIPIFENSIFITSFIADYSGTNQWISKNYSGSFMSLQYPTLIGYEYRPSKYAGIVIHDDSDFGIISQPIILKKLSESFGEEMRLPTIFRQKTFEQPVLLNLSQTTPWNRIIFSSTSSGTVYRGCLGGAVQSGLRAAIHSLLIIRPQNVTWQDINEIQRANAVKPRASAIRLFLTDFNVCHIVIGCTSVITFFIFTRLHKWNFSRNFFSDVVAKFIVNQCLTVKALFV